jgi:hypothetical protein
MSFPYAPSRNVLLQALPPLERDTLLAHLRPTALSVKTVLFEPGEAIESVHFPLDGVISLVTPIRKGQTSSLVSEQGPAYTSLGCAPYRG